MTAERTYSTREVAQMWNVSESTVKRWADDFGLRCYRTPGGHRRFSLEDISEFQRRRSFEATGLLTTDEWEDPDLEIWLNSRNFAKVRKLLLYLAGHNQRGKVKCLLERLYLRGMQLEEIYEEVLVPLPAMIASASQEGTFSSGQALLVRNNIEDALLHLSPKIIRRSTNGKTALCAAPTRRSRVSVSVLSQILEVEGWEALNLGDEVSFKIMSEIVEVEPVNLVCIFVGGTSTPVPSDEISTFSRLVGAYRIPVVVVARDKDRYSDWKELALDAQFSDFRPLRKYLARATSRL
jgi:excisionase family DNA binding protein